jgi:preprotein translocase subunit SecE
VARDRKRARQRQQRRVRETAPPSDTPPRRENLPGALQHTGEVDEFDAALVRGARPQGEPGDELAGLDDGQGVVDEPELSYRESRESPPTASLRARATAAGREEQVEERAALERPRRSAAPARPGGNRALAFLRASWAELQRVQWPDRHQVAQATAVVLGFVVIAGVYLGVADWVAQKVVNFVL